MTAALTAGRFALGVALLATGCKRDASGAGAAPAASPPPPAASAPAGASASASVPRPSAPPPAGGVAAFASADETKECSLKGRDLDQGLGSGHLAAAARGKGIAVLFHFATKTKGEALLAIGGFDSLTRTVGVAHGLGKTLTTRPHVFPRKDQWTAAWTDARGLVYTKTSWAPVLPTPDRLPAVSAEVAEHTGISQTKDGPLVATAPLASGKTAQLGIFLFAPIAPDAEPVRAIGATHHAANPEHPAIAEDGDGYVVAWENDAPAGGGKQVVVSRLDKAGKELGEQQVLSSPGRTASRPAVVTTPAGALVAWSEKEGDADAIFVRAIDPAGQLAGPSRRIGPGVYPQLVAADKGAALTFLRAAEGDSIQVATVFVAASGEPAARAITISDAGKGQKIAEAPGVAATDDGRLAFVYAYGDGMKGQMRTVKIAGCLAPE